MDAREARKRLEELRASPATRARADEAEKQARTLAKDLRPAHEEKLERALQSDREHGTLMDLCASSFAPGGRLARETGFVFLSSEPLVELGTPNFDLLILNAERKEAIFVECKGSISDPAAVVTRLLEKIHAVEANKEYMERELGSKIERMEYVICIPAPSVDKLVSDLERREKDGSLKPEQTRVLVWQADFFSSTLQLFTRFRTRPAHLAQHAITNLTRALGDGIRVSAEDVEVVPSCYPGTHPLRKAEAFLGWCLKENIKRRAPLRGFTKQDVSRFYTSARHIPHYQIASLGKVDVDAFLHHAANAGVIADKGGDAYEFTAEGAQPKTILANFRKDYQKAWIERAASGEALARVVSEIKVNQRSLTDF